MTDQVAANGLRNRRTLLRGLAKGGAVVGGGLLVPGAAHARPTARSRPATCGRDSSARQRQRSAQIHHVQP